MKQMKGKNQSKGKKKLGIKVNHLKQQTHPRKKVHMEYETKRVTYGFSLVIYHTNMILVLHQDPCASVKM